MHTPLNPRASNELLAPTCSVTFWITSSLTAFMPISSSRRSVREDKSKAVARVAESILAQRTMRKAGQRLTRIGAVVEYPDAANEMEARSHVLRVQC